MRRIGVTKQLKNEKCTGLTIQSISPHSIGARLNWKPGDRIISINGRNINDILDYRFQVAEDTLEICISTLEGNVTLYRIEKNFDDDLGVSFTEITNDGIRQCRNRCLFCFVDQMPPSLRKSLYVKDDDYRYSFLQGTFVTLTNVDEEDLKKIASMRLSPLYVSVHTTNPELRAQMMRNKKASRIMEQLEFLSQHGIEIHAQIVLCEGINDGAELARSIRELARLWPAVQSLAVVPVGLTKFRRDLPLVHGISPGNALEIVESVSRYQQEYLEKMGTRFVFLADEFYLQTGKEIPTQEEYEDFPQLENGVGIVRLFLDDFAARLEDLREPLPVQERCLIVTGRAATPILAKAVAELNRRIAGYPLELVTVENHFLGSSVTVTGLLSGADIIETLQDRLLKDSDATVLLPDIILNDDMLTIDSYHASQFEAILGNKVVFLPTNGSSLIDYLVNPS